MTKIILKKGKDAALQRSHPWIFSGAIAAVEGEAKDGDLVEVLSHDRQKMATGHFQNGSIMVRVIEFGDVPIDANFWHNKLRDAWNYRKALGLVDNAHTNAYRLVHGEGDGLSGLVVDIYGDAAVLQCHSIGMHLIRHELATALEQLYEGRLKHIFDKSKEALPFNYAAQIENGHLFGNAVGGHILENGKRFYVNWAEGQKTGFFLDQRDNRQLLGSYAQGKSVLNAYAYTGGFSAYALEAGASLVHSVDASSKAAAWANENIKASETKGEHAFFTEDVQQFLKKAPQYDIVVIDPPAFAKSLAKKHNAVQGYKRLNALALQKVQPGGLLFTFSCSQVIDRELFANTIVAAALEAGRRVRVAHQLSQSPDHPINLYHPEGSYLKGLVLYVD
jgi:23S rRNA (cytosine1962-C5)-methyltransferase